MDTGTSIIIAVGAVGILVLLEIWIIQKGVKAGIKDSLGMMNDLLDKITPKIVDKLAARLDDKLRR